MADDTPKKPCERGEEIRFGPHVEGGGRLAIRHTADHQQMIGVVRPVRDGENLTNAFTATVKDPKNGIYTYEDVAIPRHPSATRTQEISKPTKVNSPEFKTGWDAIFGRQPVGQA